MDERFLVEEKLRRRKEGTQHPSRNHEDLSALPRAGEVHRMCDGVVSIDAERHQDISRSIRGEALHELNKLARQVARFPRHRDAPNDVGQDIQQSHAQI